MWSKRKITTSTQTFSFIYVYYNVRIRTMLLIKCLVEQTKWFAARYYATSYYETTTRQLLFRLGLFVHINGVHLMESNGWSNWRFLHENKKNHVTFTISLDFSNKNERLTATAIIILLDSGYTWLCWEWVSINGPNLLRKEKIRNRFLWRNFI